MGWKFRKPGDKPDDGGAGDDAGWSDGDRDGRGFDGSWSRTRPTFDNPMSWSVPFFRAANIDVRIHITFLLLIAYLLIRAAWPAANDGASRLSLGMTAALIGFLFAVVLLHEFGHCLACRRTGGTADEILMWPLGGLAYCNPRHAWVAHLWTAIGGPLVNVAILLVTIPTLGITTGAWWGVAIPMPLRVEIPAALALSSDVMILVYLLHQVTFTLLVFNLLPLFPLDGGRIVQALLWPRLGYTRSMRVACRAGLIGAIVLGVIGAVATDLTLLFIAIFGAGTSYLMLKRLEFTEEQLGFEDTEGTSFAAVHSATDAAEGRERAAERARQEKLARKEETQRAKDDAKRLKEEAEFDRILDKIQSTGIDSLTAAEKHVLARETERRRRESR
ncbi:MAG: site-2 protease family protein [Phycisphaerae bacterium]|nr:site-2 protease family protein [Phycisphaerae bacterium]